MRCFRRVNGFHWAVHWAVYWAVKWAVKWANRDCEVSVRDRHRVDWLAEFGCPLAGRSVDRHWLIGYGNPIAKFQKR